MAPSFRPPCAPPLYPIGAAHPPGTFVVTRSFGDLSFPQHGAHDGLDIGNGRIHDPILAVAPGTVTQAAFVPEAGGAAIVRINHGGGWTSGYAHMDRIDVGVGQVVLTGTQIGILGSTGWTSGAHLHFDLTLNNVRQDPWPLLQGDDVNLPPSLEPMAAGTFPTNLAIRSSPQVPANPEANVLERLAADTRLGILFPLAGQGGYLGPDNTVRRDWFATGIGPGSGVLAYVAAAYGSNVMLTDAGRRYVTQASGGFTLTQLNDAKKATADKANAQMDAWTAGRPRIVP